jgi:hypothetical protein
VPAAARSVDPRSCQQARAALENSRKPTATCVHAVREELLVDLRANFGALAACQRLEPATPGLEGPSSVILKSGLQLRPVDFRGCDILSDDGGINVSRAGIGIGVRL